MTERCPERVNVGAFLAGALVAEEHARFAVHLSTCDECSGEANDLAPVFAMLDQVFESASLGDEPDLPAGLRDRVLGAVDRAGTDAVMESVRRLDPSPPVPLAARSASVTPTNVRPRQIRRSWIAAAAAAIVVLVGGFAATQLGGSSGGSQIALSTLTTRDPVTMKARVKTLGTGTVVELVVENSIPDAQYGVWFEAPDGKRISVGSFRGRSGEIRFRGETAVRRDGIVALGAWSDGGDVTRAEL